LNRYGITKIIPVVLLLGLLVWFAHAHFAVTERSKPFTDLIAMIQAGKVAEVDLSADRASFIDTSKQHYYSTLNTDPNDPNQLVAIIISYNLRQPAGHPQIKLVNEPPGIFTEYQGVLNLVVGPALILIILWFFFLRQVQSSGNQAVAFGRAKMKRISDSNPKITFEDVAGVDEAKQELSEIVEFLRNRKKFEALGAKVPKGVLLLGPPGCGKTMLARAIAGEADVPFWHISGSDFVEMFVGVGASRVRDLFETAKASAPSLIFIDEIDAVGRQRGAGLGGGHDEREQTLNQLLVEMDGFDPNKGVILVAATNRPDILDPALTRPGRFDRRVTVDNPDVKGREAILLVHTKGKPLADDVNAAVLARRTPGFSGADLANLVNEAALLAARKEQHRIEMFDFEESIDRVLAGPERRSRILTDQEKLTTAVHEAGHAVVARMCPGANAVHKVSIVSRGMALGYTITLATEDKHNYSRQELIDRVTYGLGGRAAEELVFNEFNTGAYSDLDTCADIARSMVCDYGMSDRLGPVVLGRRHRNPFLGRDYMEDRNYSEDVAKAIDDEVRRIITDCYDRALRIVKEYKAALDEVVKVLLEQETLSGEEFAAIFERNHPAGSKSPLPAVS